jgi:hypothetical protein
MRTGILLSILLCLLLLAGGCRTSPPYAAAPPQEEQGVERNHGYALLYATIVSETSVDQVLIIKRPRREVADLLRAIGEFARDAMKRLEQLAEDDPTLGFSEHGLPQAEGRTRDLITSATSNAVILSAGRSFEFTILLTQHEALNYIAHLAKAVKELDDVETRRELLDSISTDAEKLHGQVIELMKSAYVSAPE